LPSHFPPIYNMEREKKEKEEERKGEEDM